jgi:hypothetical protein
MDLKREYNKLLERAKKAEAYLDDKSIPENERNKWGAEYVKILDGLGELIKLNQKSGYVMSGEEILNGIEVGPW